MLRVFIKDKFFSNAFSVSINVKWVFFLLKLIWELYWLIFKCWNRLCISSVQSLSHVRLFATPWITACQASLSITKSRSLPNLMSIELVMPSNHLILCCPLLLPLSVFPSIRVFSHESDLHIRLPKYWSFQLQHQSFRWKSLEGLIGRFCIPRINSTWSQCICISFSTLLDLVC